MKELAIVVVAGLIGLLTGGFVVKKFGGSCPP